jgi:glc operon protein GlcG
MADSSKSSLLTGYGSLSLETSRKVAAAAVAEARKQGWNVAVSIVDAAGELIYFERIDDTQPASIVISQGKARTAARFKRPSKMLEDALVGGRQAILRMPDAIPIEGGIPLVIGGRIAGAIGVSGVTSQQDGVCAQAGVAALAALEAG